MTKTTDLITTGRFLAEVQQKLAQAENTILAALSALASLEEILHNMEKHFHTVSSIKVEQLNG